MENQQQITVSGQELQAGDFNNVALEAAHADDYVLAELLRLAPMSSGVVARGVLPMGMDGLAAGGTFDSSQNVIVRPTFSADGSLFVYPFRSVIGSRTDQTTAPGTPPNPQLLAWRDIRSAIYCPPNANGLGFPKVAIGANASGNPRWDLIYAVHQIDTASATVPRFVKPPSPSTAPGATQNISTQLLSAVTLGTVTGTAAASPVFPTIPADTVGSTYFVPLAYVRVPNGFSGTSTIAATDICDAAPVLGIYSSARAMPANGQFKAGGVVVPTAVQQSWGSSGTRPTAYAPAAIGMGPTRFILLDLLSGSSANWSHQNGSVVDNSTDWTLRWFRATAMASNAGGVQFSSEHTVPSPGLAIPQQSTSVVQMGNSMVTGGSLLLLLNSGNVSMGGGAAVSLSVDSSGRIVVGISGSPTCKIFIWLESSQPFSLR